MLVRNTVHHGDCLELMKDIADNYIDLTVTSPPYDNLRTYNGSLIWGEHIWKPIIKELYRITKQGGVVVWVVGDATIKGSETGTSFKQALWAKECGFNLHDTMIFQKDTTFGGAGRGSLRYSQEFEYMFIFSKGQPKTFNPIMIDCKYAGKTFDGSTRKNSQSDGQEFDAKRKLVNATVNKYKRKGNICKYGVGIRAAKNRIAFKHPAIFPEKMVQDHITSWSNEGDIVLDCFGGSGTTAIACINTNRDYILMEQEQKYVDIINKRIAEHII